MGITSANKFVNARQIDCDGSFLLSIAITGAPDINSNPTDIVLVLDRSGSMSGTPMANLKLGADAFIDIIQQATNPNSSDEIGGGSRIGIVSFADTATKDVPLSTSTTALKAAVNGLTADGSTNHADAFTKAMEEFDLSSTNAKVILMFTDGKTTAGAPPLPVAQAAKAAGITIYIIGLIGSDGIDVPALESWASLPSATHVAVTPDAAELERLFQLMAANITKPGPTNISIDEILNPDFRILSFAAPAKGSVQMLSNQRLLWTIPALGTTQAESALLEITVQHIGSSSGLKEVNQEILYHDREGNIVSFPEPTIMVDCGGGPVYPEPCPEPQSFVVPNCNDYIEFSADDLPLAGQGRIVEMDVTVRNVCPNTRVALGVVLTEVDESGTEYHRGTKTYTLPAHNGTGCQDVLVRCIRFVLPEDLYPDGEPRMCSQRNLNVRTIAHAIDSQYRCCGTLDAVVTR